MDGKFFEQPNDEAEASVETIPEAEIVTDKGDAAIIINYIRDQVYMLGGNNSEFSQFEEILDAVEKGRISPQEGIDKAHEIRASKGAQSN